MNELTDAAKSLKNMGQRGLDALIKIFTDHGEERKYRKIGK